MASLLKDRVQVSRPFQKVGIDFSGLLLTKCFHVCNAPIIESYIVLFVCMVTKAVYFDLITILSTEAFLMTLTRFISRHDKNVLQKPYEFLQRSEIKNALKVYLSQNKSEWRPIS